MEYQYLTTGDVAKLIGVTPETVGRWAKKGLIRHITTPGGHRRFSAQAVNELLATMVSR